MKINTEEYLKSALLNSEDRARDFMDVYHEVENPEIKQFLLDYAETEGIKAQQIKDMLEQKTF